MTNEHTSLEKYTSHTLFKRGAKGLCVRGKLETEQTATYWPKVPLSLAALLSHSGGLLNRGSWGPKSSAGSWFSLPRTATWNPTNWHQLTRTLCGPGLYNYLASPCFMWASHLHRIQPVHAQGYILISSTGCTCFLIDCKVEGQYVTIKITSIYLSIYRILIYINMHIYTCTFRIHIDAIIKTSDTVLRKIYHSLYLKGLYVRGSWRLNKDCNILTSPAPPHLVSNLSDLQLTDFLSSPSYIIVQSPTQSLEWHVWSSYNWNNGNNCQAVHRSLSSGASVY